ncbi:MAG: M81 family metallopeptidase [Verrucomicrobiales bacterium]|nr:M81 family metallopeptidase [Verrucomicrobiales bacterium]
MRIGIVALLQESNTFVSGKTRLEHFERELLLTGEAIRNAFVGAEHEVGGFFAALEGESDFEAVPIFAARALPYGTIEASTFDELVRRLLDGVREAGSLDGILAAPHGATAAENHPDADGSWLGKLREQVGPDLPIIATLDPHGNLSPAMVAATDALVAYSTNPHLDQRDTGLRAADLMKRTLRGEIRPTQAAAFPPLQINIQSQNTGEAPMSEFYTEAGELAAEADVLSHSIMLGFPYADVNEMGSSVIVVTNNNSALASEVADKIAGRMWERREQFDPEFTDVTAAVARARSNEGTNVLLDMGDNIGGGSPGDSTFILHELERTGTRSLVIIDDPASVTLAEKCGIGEPAEFSIGGENDTLHGAPLNVVATVKSLHDGRFSESRARHGGITNFDQGRTAIIETENGVTIMLTSQRTPPFSLAQITTFGIAPTDYRAIVAKGVIAPIAAYAEIADHFIHVNTPGVTCADMRQLDFKNRRRPMFPFEK